MTELMGPSWDLSSEYTSTTDTQIDIDLNESTRLLDEIEAKNATLLPFLDRLDDLSKDETARVIVIACEVYVLSQQVSKLVRDPGNYAECLLSVDSTDKNALHLQGKLRSYRLRFSESLEPTSQFLELASDEIIAQYLSNERVSDSTWSVRHSRKRRHELLSLEEENLATALGQDGIHAWGRLYSQLSGTLRCNVADGNEQREVGIAEAASLMQSTNDRTREDAWRAINSSWSEHLETCTAAINAIAGWRLEMCKRRSSQIPVHYLDGAVHASHINRNTLDTLMDVAAESRPLAQRAAKAMAQAYSKEKIGPWDQRAPAPELPGKDARIPFSDGLNIVSDAYGEVDASMGEFIQMMSEKNWIEGTVSNHKRPGAYCTSFAKSRTPRVYMTYSGSMTDITILAHELGHAFHHWTMRKLPDSQRGYGMSLAETASTFGETLVRDALMRRADDPVSELAVAWEEMSAITSFLLNIPTRYTFERNFYDQRSERPLQSDELREIMADAWREWHGDALSEPDDLFWVNKLHFYISGTSFYNFPYLFGYLFSQSIYQRRDQMGSEFFDRYCGLLMDTGRMSAEELATKHLDADITQPEFWSTTVAALEPRVEQFERVVAQTVT